MKTAEDFIWWGMSNYPSIFITDGSVDHKIECYHNQFIESLKQRDKEIWNQAIEAASEMLSLASCGESADSYAQEILRLKKPEGEK